MITMTDTMTAISPSFGMPAYGQTSITGAAISAFAGVPVSTCARVRFMADLGHTAAKGQLPGTRAWRPPTC